MRKLFTVLMSVLSLGLVAMPAYAALTAPTLGLTDVETIAGAVIVFLAAVWGIKIALGFFRGGR